MSIMWIVRLRSSLQKLGKKYKKQKAELKEQENDVGNKIKKKLKRELEVAESMIDVELDDRVRH